MRFAVHFDLGPGIKYSRRFLIFFSEDVIEYKFKPKVSLFLIAIKNSSERVIVAEDSATYSEEYESGWRDSGGIYHPGEHTYYRYTVFENFRRECLLFLQGLSSQGWQIRADLPKAYKQWQDPIKLVYTISQKGKLPPSVYEGKAGYGMSCKALPTGALLDIVLRRIDEHIFDLFEESFTLQR